jgi:hypothetical protein
VTWLAWGASGSAAGVLLAAILAMTAPHVTIVRVGEPGGLVPPMLSGVHDVERTAGRAIRWTSGHARLRWDGRFGADPTAVVVTMAGFPGASAGSVDVGVNGRVTRHVVADQFGDVRVPLPAGTRAPLDIEIASLTTRPPGDGRILGVRLEAIAIEHPARTERFGAVRGGAGVVALGLLAVLTGAWAAGVGATHAARVRGAGLAWIVAAVTAMGIAPFACRAETLPLVAPLMVGVLTVALLARAGHAPMAAGGAGLVIAVQGMVILTWCASAFVDLPRWDIWELVPLIEKQATQGLTLHDLWAQHNEHRPMIARLILLGNVALSRWNHWNELWLILAITGAHVLLLVASLRHADHQCPIAVVVLVAGAGTFIATATQWENLLQGWQIALLVGAASVSAAFVLLTRGALTWTRAAAAATCVMFGTAGFASCLLAWPLGALAIALRRGPGWRAKALTWGALGAAVGVAYVHGLVRPGGLPPPAPILTSLDACLRVVYGTCLALAMPVWYVATPFAETHHEARWVLPGIGGASLVVGAALVVAHLRHPGTRRAQVWLLPALWMLFAVAACGIAAIGRVPLGLHAMTASRYIAFTGLFWVGLLYLLTVATPCRSSVGRAASLTLAVVIVVAGLRAWGDSLPQFEQHRLSGVRGRDALLRADWPNTLGVYPSPPILDQRRKYLMQHGLSLYRPGAR